MLEELNKIKKEELELIKTYLKEFTVQIENDVNNYKKEEKNLKKEISEKIKEKDYKNISILSKRARELDIKLHDKEEKLESVKRLLGKYELYTFDLSKFTSNEELDLEKVLLSVSENDELREKLHAFKVEKLSLMKNNLIECQKKLYDDISTTQSLLENFDTKANKILSEGNWDELVKLSEKANDANFNIESKKEKLIETNKLIENIKNYISNVHSNLVEYNQDKLENEIIILMDSIMNYNFTKINNLKDENIEKHLEENEIKNRQKKDLEKANDDIVKAIEISDLTKLEEVETKVLSLDDCEEKERILTIIKYAKGKICENKIKNAKKAVLELETNMTTDALNFAQKSVSLIEDDNIKKDLEECIKKSKKEVERNDKIKADWEQINKDVDKAMKNFDLEKLNEVNNAVLALDDCIEKENLLEKINYSKVELMLIKCEKDIEEKSTITSSDVSELIDLYRNLNGSGIDRNNIKDRLNKVIKEYNIQEKYYNEAEKLEEKPKKYGFITLTSEFITGKIFNLCLNSKFYMKWHLNKLKNAMGKSDDKKIIKQQNKINQIGIINGFILFKQRNKIASLKPKLYNTSSENGYKSYPIKYANVVNRVTGKISKKLGKLTNNELVLKNKAIATNIIMQYLDALSIADNSVENSDFERIYNDTINFIEKANDKKTIDINEFYAYMQEIRNIMDYRERYDKDVYYMPYSVDIKEINNMIDYYDADSYSNEIIPVIRKGNN